MMVGVADVARAVEDPRYPQFRAHCVASATPANVRPVATPTVTSASPCLQGAPPAVGRGREVPPAAAGYARCVG
jgi:hypothetical protein